VRPAHLHLFSRNNPNRPFEIKLFPLCVPELAWPNEQLALPRGIETVADKFTGPVPLTPSLGSRDIGIASERQGFLLAGKPIGKAP
jgi:hypothetical protein